MTNVGGIAGEVLKSFVERIERLDEERRAIAVDIKEVFAEAKGGGFDTKIMRQVIRLRRMDKDDLDEQESLLEIYKAALGMLSDTPLGEAALRTFHEQPAAEPIKRGRGRPRATPPANGATAPVLGATAREIGKQDGFAGERAHADQFPAGHEGHADYELGVAEAERALAGSVATH